MAPHKSYVMVWKDEPPNWLSEMGWNWSGTKTITRYLGIPFSLDPSFPDMWEWIFNKINGKHIRWQTHSLSLAGEFRLYRRFFLFIISFLLWLGCLQNLSLVCLKKFSEIFCGQMTWDPKEDIFLNGSDVASPNSWGACGLKTLEYGGLLLRLNGYTKIFGGMNLGRFL